MQRLLRVGGRQPGRIELARPQIDAVESRDLFIHERDRRAAPERIRDERMPVDFLARERDEQAAGDGQARIDHRVRDHPAGKRQGVVRPRPATRQCLKNHAQGQHRLSVTRWSKASTGSNPEECQAKRKSAAPAGRKPARR